MSKSSVDKVLLILGAVFCVFGVPCLISAIALVIALPSEGIVAFLVPGLLGTIFTSIGLSFLVGVFSRIKKRKFLLQNGVRVQAFIQECEPDYSVRVNGRHAYVLRCAWQAPDGRTFIFKSGRLMKNPQEFLTCEMVYVYYDPSDIKKYYVDVEGSYDPNVVEL